MALVACMECGKDVSDKAAACIGCGAPIGDSVSAGTPLVTTQGTSKKLKAQQLAAAIVMTFAFLKSCSAASHENEQSLVIWGLIALAGAAWSIFIRLQIWWHHR